MTGPLLAVLLVPLTGGSDEVSPAAYRLGPDSLPREGVPAGTVEQFSFTAGEDSRYPGTVRAVRVYRPAGFDAAGPAALMIFTDGRAYADPDGQVRAPTVLDNLIRAGEIPPLVGVFVDPGVVPAAVDGAKPRPNRSFEYDTLSPRYAEFLIEELLPEVGRRYGLRFTDDPDRRAVVGASSGGIAAFTAAWERPDSFRKVVSQIGSFTNIRGGHVYPALIRKTERKPIRVHLQDGANDLDNLHGNWPLANRQMAAALAFQEYDHEFVMGTGGHSREHGGAIFPDTLRWLWRDWNE